MDALDWREFWLRMARTQIDVELGRVKLARAAQEATCAFERFGMALQASVVASSDLAEFDNRAHDWLR